MAFKKEKYFAGFAVGLLLLSGCKTTDSSATFSSGNRSAPKRKPVSEQAMYGAETAAAKTPAAKPGNAVTKGSFTVWSVPKDPQPSEAYQIFIEVKLPPNTQKYTRDDLSGSVVGTDGFSLPLARSADAFPDIEQTQTFQFDGLTARFSTFIPGGAEAVRDTIKVQSILLNEQQIISVAF